MCRRPDAHGADAVAHRGRRPSPGRAHRAVAGREHERLTLRDGGRRWPGTAPAAAARRRRTRRPCSRCPGGRGRHDLQREHELAVEVAVQRVPVARPVAQQQRRRAPLAGGVARSSQSSKSSGHGAGWPSRSAQSRAIGSRWGQNAARSSLHDAGQRVGEVAVLALGRSGGGPCRRSSGTGRRRRRGRRAPALLRRRAAAPVTAHPRSSSSAADRPVDRSLTRRRPAVRRGGGHAAASMASRAALASAPPRYSPMVPSLRTTRWQGTTSGTGLWRRRVPTARTAPGMPAAAATPA